MNKSNMKKHISGKMRIWIVVSICWVIFMSISFSPWTGTPIVRDNFAEWLLLTCPVWIGWGIWWIRKGFSTDKEKNNQEDNLGN